MCVHLDKPRNDSLVRGVDDRPYVHIRAVCRHLTDDSALDDDVGVVTEAFEHPVEQLAGMDDHAAWRCAGFPRELDGDPIRRASVRQHAPQTPRREVDEMLRVTFPGRRLRLILGDGRRRAQGGASVVDAGRPQGAFADERHAQAVR